MSDRWTAFAIAAAVLVGASIGLLFVPAWTPLLADVLGGPQPKGWWLLSRATGFTAYGALWLSMAMGLLITNRWSRIWPGGPMAVDVHRHSSVLALVLALVHAMVLLGDRYVSFTVGALLLPFASPTPNWLAIGAGQLTLYLLAVTVGSFYVRRSIGVRLWRAIHFGVFVVFTMATVHGVTSGRDSAAPVYWTAAGTILFLTVHRLLRALPIARVGTEKARNDRGGASG
jgi:predicted ferric reductase